MPAPLSPSPVAAYRRRFTEQDATRLLWRAGFGPKPGEAAHLARKGLDGAVRSLTRPVGPARLIGRPPHANGGTPLDPINVWGDDHCWWMDRMVRSTHQLVERMTLVWHSWFATSVLGSTAKWMLKQNEMMRGHALGNFHQLLLDVTCDPAMLMWLSNNTNTKYAPNENYAREVMELFTLGADRGYSQDDVHDQARALTGWTNSWSDATGASNFHYAPELHDAGVKTIFGHRGEFDWRDSCRLCVQHPLHPSFMVSKLWGYFIGVPPSRGTLHRLERAYVGSGYETRPLIEAILRHPAFYEGPRMVIPPAVYAAGLLRGLGDTVQTGNWSWICEQAGQRLFLPPNVAGWDYTTWLDTSRWAGRFTAVSNAMAPHALNVQSGHYPASETPEQAVAAALRFWRNPPISARTRASLIAFSRRVESSITADWQRIQYRVMRQNALRGMIPATPDWQTC